MPKIVIYDIENVVGPAAPFLLTHRFEIYTADTRAELLSVVSHKRPEILLLGVAAEFGSVCLLTELIETCRSQLERIQVIVVAPPLPSELLVKLMRAGVRDCLLQPVTLEQIVERVHVALPELPYVPTPSRPEPGPLGRIIGLSRAMVELRAALELYARSDSTLLLLGESGTGKDLAARVVHDLSERSNGPFVAQNCGAIPDSLAESEILGAERGAYTDAVSRPGMFEMANQGTLFLDEVGELSMRAQTKLLRVIEDQHVRRIGATRSVPVDVRLIAATNRDLSAEVEAGSFRRDLYHRLMVLAYRIPPLRDRVDDIPLLADHLLNELYVVAVQRRKGKATATPRCRLTEDAVRLLQGHSWRGNVRELMNVLERSSAHSTAAELGVADIRLEP